VAGNKINADATLHLAAGSFHEWPSIGKDAVYDPNGFYYIYVVPEDPTRAGDISLDVYQNETTIGSFEVTTDRSLYGVVRFVVRNRSTSTGLAFASWIPRIHNNGATALDYFVPSLTKTDDVRIPRFMMAKFSQKAPIVQPEIRTFEFWRDSNFFETNWDQYLRSANLAIDSVSGADANAGTRWAAKQTLASIGAAGSMTNGEIVALRRGSVWNEQLVAFYGATAAEVVFVADDRGRKGNLPKISAWKAIPNASLVDNGNGTFTFTFTGSATSLPALNASENDGVSRVNVRERNTALDAAGNVISAGTMLRWVANTTDLMAAPGRAYATYSAGTWTVTVNPRAGVGFGAASGVTYEVTQQASCILWASGQTNGYSASILGLHLDGAADRYGMFSAGPGSKADFCVLTGGDTHHSVIASGTYSRCLIASVGDTQDSISVFYNDGGLSIDSVNRYDRCFIFAKGGPYAHNALGAAYSARASLFEHGYYVFERDKLYNGALGSAGDADWSLTAIKRRNYVKGALNDIDKFSTGMTTQHVVSEGNLYDGIVRMQAQRGGCYDNIYITQNYGDQNPANPANRGVIGLQASPGGSFTNNLVVVTHASGNFVPSSVSNYQADYGGTVINEAIFGNAIPATAQATIRRNIFVIYMPYAASQAQNISLYKGAQSSFGQLDLDENIYILLNVGSNLSLAGVPTQDVTAPPTFVPSSGTGGTANAIALTTGKSLVANPATIAFTTGAAANTGAVTVSIDGLTAVALKSSAGADLAAGALSASTRYGARWVTDHYELLSFQSYTPGHLFLKQKTGYEQNGLIIDARGHPLGLNAVFKDFANRDLRWANTDIADRILRFNRERAKAGLPPVGPSWTINRQVEQITVDDAYTIISRRAPLLQAA
jgi:hypothetical protein